MELIREDKNKKIFSEGDNKIYSMLDMGSYVGHRNRQWYYSAPEVWKLMFLDEKREDGKECHIETLIDDRGNYTRFLVDLDNVRRVIQVHNGMVFSDRVFELGYGADGMLNDVYIAMDGDIYSESKVLLEEYLTTNPEFSLNGRKFQGEIPGNDLVSEFLTKNDELNQMLEFSKKR